MAGVGRSYPNRGHSIISARWKKYFQRLASLPMPKFSVIIPTLNSPTLARTLSTIEQQAIDRAQVEIIVVGMDQWLKSGDWGTFYPTATPVPPGTARNRGAAHASGEILAFIDSDCLAKPNWLTVLAEQFRNPNITIIGGGVDFSAENYWTLADNLSMFYEYLSSLPAGQREQLPSLNLALRRETFLSSGGFDETRRTAEDSDLTIRLRKQGHILRFEPRAMVTHMPPRSRAVDLFRHHFLHGQYSTKFDPRYHKNQGFRKLLSSRLGILLAAPLLAAGVTLKIFLLNRHLWRYWYCAPAILAAKFVWCLGAAFHPAPHTTSIVPK